MPLVRLKKVLRVVDGWKALNEWEQDEFLGMTGLDDPYKNERRRGPG